MLSELSLQLLWQSLGDKDTAIIIGGQEARPHSHPYMAYVQIPTPRPKTCGGFLVREDFVMTAAHCLGSQISVILGAHNVSRLERTQQRIPVLRAIPHPRYNQQNNQNDIMLLQVPTLWSFTRAAPSQLGGPGRGKPSRLPGWRTDTLQDVWIRVQRGEECSRLFMFYTDRTQICVGDPRERKSAFLVRPRGDSGGPLVCNNVAQGIVSYGKRIGTPPAVFTRISSFLPWIRRTMRRFKEWGLE
uniref:Peptidase S1 domain-containing protein n=1 Tax=Balaenoptera musculus TaxID=9771 RepID=A0A8C0D8E4_BALMU